MRTRVYRNVYTVTFCRPGRPSGWRVPRTVSTGVRCAFFVSILAGNGLAVLRRHSMRGATHAKWAAGAAAVALAVTGCGGGGSDSGGGDGSAVLSSSWGDPQNPLEPANTNEVQGGKVL